MDGRQEPHSAGMTLPEIARLFESAGIDQALNLDGGGSSALVLGHSHVNRPSDATGERPVVNALALITDSTCVKLIEKRMGGSAIGPSNSHTKTKSSAWSWLKEAPTKGIWNDRRVVFFVADILN